MPEISKPEFDSSLQNKSLKKIAILISGKGSNMEMLIRKVQSDDLDVEIAAVISDNFKAEGLQTAKSLGISARVFDYKNLGRSVAEESIRRFLSEAEVDLVVLAGFMKLLSAEFVDHFRNRIVNIHPSLLPSFKGAHAIKDAFEYGVKYTGVSIHYVNEEMDGGAIIAQEVVCISENETLESLETKIHAIEYELYWKTLKKLLANNIQDKNGIRKIVSGQVFEPSQKTEHFPEVFSASS